MFLVGVGDGRVQHHRPRQAVALDEDVAGGAERTDGHRVRDHHDVLWWRVELIEDGATHELARHGHPAAGADGGRHGPPEVPALPPGVGGRSLGRRLQRLQVVQGEHRGRRSADRQRAPGMVDEVEGVGTSGEPGRLGGDAAPTGPAVDRGDLGGCTRRQLRVALRERRQHEQPHLQLVGPEVEQAPHGGDRRLLAAADLAGHEPQQVDADADRGFVAHLAASR